MSQIFYDLQALGLCMWIPLCLAHLPCSPLPLPLCLIQIHTKTSQPLKPQQPWVGVPTRQSRLLCLPVHSPPRFHPITIVWLSCWTVAPRELDSQHPAQGPGSWKKLRKHTIKNLLNECSHYSSRNLHFSASGWSKLQWVQFVNVIQNEWRFK